MTDEKRIINRVSPEAEQGRQEGGAVLVAATYIAARSQIAGTENKATEPVNRKERAQLNKKLRAIEEKDLLKWSKAEKIFISEAEFNRQWHNRKIAEGAEQQVYLDYSGLSVIKTNDAIMHGTWLEFFDRIALHNWLFPEVAYQLSGFTKVKSRLGAIIHQPFIKSERGASREEVENDMVKRRFIRLKNDDYFNPALGIILEDLHDENVLNRP